jgi:branched-chain amino acid transport system substrate-binding protein
MTSILRSGAALCALVATTQAGLAQEDVKIGLLLGFTGPVESLMPPIAAGAELAFDEVNASGLFLGGQQISAIRADSTCTDASAAMAAGERLVTADGVAAILGAACSGATSAVVSNVAVPNGVVALSPSATSPGLSTLEDNGLFFRTAPSDARQGEVLAELAIERGVDEIAVTYTNNDYGQGLADSFTRAFEALGGTVLVSVSHEDGRGDYSAEVGTLAASGASDLLVIGYVDQGGREIVRTAVELGAFERFVLPDGMIGDTLLEEFGELLEGSFGTVPGNGGAEASDFAAMAAEAGFDASGPFVGEAYDAGALLALAMQAAGSSGRDAFAGHILDVANAPGTRIGPGELAEGLRILSEGGDIDYVGVSGVEMTEIGDATGSFRELEVQGSDFQTVRIW